MDTLTARQFRLASCQATLFTATPAASSATTIRDLLSKWSSLLDADPIIFPREGLPAELPRIILESSSGSWRCEIASSRANFYWRRTDGASSSPTISSFYEEALKYLTEYKNSATAKVWRLAAVLNRFAEHNTPALFLARHFCQTRWDKAPLNRPESFELHAHKRFSLGRKYLVNSWVRNKTALLATDERPIVLVEQDLNTPGEEASARQFSDAEISEFFRLAEAEFETILNLYYPEPRHD